MHTERLCRVLIIEDDPIDREIYKRCLEHSPVWQFELQETGSGGVGIDLAAAWRPDCILLDFNLPDVDGIDVLSRIGTGGFETRRAVVMLTAFGNEALAVQAMKAGAMDYLPKGRVDVATLQQTIINAVERFEMQQQIDAQRTELEESGRRYQVLLEAIPEMVWTADRSGRVQYANSRWFEYTGLGLSEACHLGWDRVVHVDDREKSWRAWEQSVKSGSILEIEHRLRRASDGSFRWHLVRAVPMETAADETRWFGTSTDIETQKLTERARLQRQKLEGIGLLAGGVAHDFNNLLVGILGGASYAAECLPTSHPAQSMLRGVIQAGERAAELTRKMLAYAGKGALYIEPTDLNRLVSEACTAMQASFSPAARLTFETGAGVPLVETDAAQMRQVIVDLVRNASEAIGDLPGEITVRTGTIEIETESGETDEFDAVRIRPGRYVALEVSDTGCGMNDETRKKIFDPFFSTKFTGRGLGLAAVQGFVRSSGGVVQVESSEGRGARFRILLPAGASIEATKSVAR